MIQEDLGKARKLSKIRAKLRTARSTSLWMLLILGASRRDRAGAPLFQRL
jgi:3'-phosphoadenosine 5'-phosphosulfate sulfotransferase